MNFSRREFVWEENLGTVRSLDICVLCCGLLRDFYFLFSIPADILIITIYAFAWDHSHVHIPTLTTRASIHIEPNKIYRYSRYSVNRRGRENGQFSGILKIVISCCLK